MEVWIDAFATLTLVGWTAALVSAALRPSHTSGPLPFWFAFISTIVLAVMCLVS